MNILEFNMYIREHMPSEIVYRTDAQFGFSIADPLRIDSRYESIIISLNPAIVFLKSSTNTLRINRVKTITVEENAEGCSSVYSITCGDKSGSKNDVVYKLIAS